MSYNNKMEIAVLCIPGTSQTLEDNFYIDGRCREWLDSSIVNIVTEDVVHDGIYAVSTNGESYLNESRISVAKELKRAQESFVRNGGDINSKTRILKEQIGQINSVLYTASLNNAEIKETSLSCICIEKNHYTLLTCGESKTFIYQNGIARQLTNSISKINRLISLGIMTEEQAKGINMGDDSDGIIQYPEASLSSNDIIVMCSGAASNYLDDEYVSLLLNSNKSMSSVCTQLLQQAVADGVESDLSVMIVKVGESEVIEDAFLEEFEEEDSKLTGVVAAILAAFLTFIIGVALGFLVLPNVFASQERMDDPVPATTIEAVQTEAPTENIYEVRTKAPTKKPMKAPTKEPTKAPTRKPTKAPTKAPTSAPTKSPTKAPESKPTKAPEVNKNANETYYTIKSGDTLSKIAKLFYGDSTKYKIIMKANNITDAGALRVGQKLLIPKAE